MLKPLVDPSLSNLTVLQQLQEEACRFVKVQAGEQITGRYPYYKQLNVIAQGDVAAKAEMTAFINDRRADCDAKEVVINACADADSLEALPFLAPWVSGKYLFDGTDWTLNENWVDPTLATQPE